MIFDRFVRPLCSVLRYIFPCLLTLGCSTEKQHGAAGSTDALPGYVEYSAAILHAPAKQLTFPLTAEDLRDIKTLEDKYHSEKICAGLAAPQIGIEKAIIIFAVPNNPGMKRFRKDLVQTMPKTIWINPSYEAVGEKKRSDWEGCLSVPTEAGFIKRPVKIRYTAFDVKGKKVTGVAKGYLARLIQHEIDHIKGHICMEKAIKKMPLDAYKAMRKKLIGNDSSQHIK